MTRRMRTAYDATVTPSHATKLVPALKEQFGGKGATISLVYITAKGKALDSARGAHRARLVVMVPE